MNKNVIYIGDNGHKTGFGSGSVFDSNANSIFCKLMKLDKEKEIIIVLSLKRGFLTDYENVLRFLLKYKHGYIVYVDGECRDVGTLIALGAKEIVMNEYSSLGQVDPSGKQGDGIIYSSFEVENKLEVAKADQYWKYFVKFSELNYNQGIKNLLFEELSNKKYPYYKKFTVQNMELELPIRKANKEEEKEFFSEKNSNVEQQGIVSNITKEENQWISKLFIVLICIAFYQFLFWK